MNVLVLNSGSSSLKFGLYLVEEDTAEVIGSGSVPQADQEQAIVHAWKLLADFNMSAPDAIGHRIVHGGPRLPKHSRIDASVMHEMESATALAPLHMPSALSLIHRLQMHYPEVPQVACFDTSFHAEMPDVARVLAIPKHLYAEGMQRYGFHGLSCESIVHQLGCETPGRLVIAHLGNGSSVTAVLDERSIDTSMGLTPTGGVIMGTRSGDLDPGVLLYLMREKKLDPEALEDLVNHRSGLLGISAASNDMRTLRDLSAMSADARLAIQMFCYSVRKQIAAMIAALNGIDMLVFTGGIGENHPQVRTDICQGLYWIGVRLNEDRNQSACKSAHVAISDETSRCRVLVLPSLEDEQIALHTATLI